MASTINASTSAGVITTADTSGILQLQTAGTTAVTIDASQNVGLGVTPSAWGSRKALEVGNAGSALFSVGANQNYLTSNSYFDGAFKYGATGTATAYQQYAGTHAWLNATSGSAGGVITFTQAMTLDASGNLGVGNTSPGSFARLTVQDSGSGAGTLALISSAASNAIYIKNTGTSADFKYNDAYPMTWSINGTERMRLDSSGNLGLGATPSAWGSGSKALQINSSLSLWSQSSTNNYIYANAYFDGTNDKYVSTAEAARVRFAGATTIFYYAASGTAGTNISWSESMRIDTSGNLLVGTTSGSTHVIKQVNGSLGTPFAGGIPSLVVTSNITNSVSHYFGDAGAASYAYHAWYRENVGPTDFQFWNYTTYAGKISGSAWYQGNNSSSWSTTSDIRLKQNVRPISDALGKIMALNPCHFEYKTQTGKTKTGFIANEFEQVLPGHVHETDPTDEFKDLISEGEKIKCIDADLIPYLTAAIKEQQALIQILTDRITALEAK